MPETREYDVKRTADMAVIPTEDEEGRYFELRLESYPENTIHRITPEQLQRLHSLVEDALERPIWSAEQRCWVASNWRDKS